MENTVQALDHAIETAPDGGQTRYSHFEASEAVLRPLMDELFLKHWTEITIGPCVQGAAFEIKFESAPKVTYFDGYLTVNPGPWHFHMCIGPTRSSKSEELCRNRPIAKAALMEIKGSNSKSWGLRFWNGYNEQVATVFLPSPRWSNEFRKLDPPDWRRLAFYYELRSKLLGEPVPADLEAASTAPWPESAV